MLILANTTDRIEINLGGAVATNQARCLVCWRDVTATTYVPGRTVTLSNNATDVDISGSPATSTQRVIDLVNVYNADTAPVNVTITYDANGTEYVLWTGVVPVGETLSYVQGAGWSLSGPATIKVLGQQNPSAATLATAYTVPAATTANVRTITICNRSAVATSFRVAVRPGGAAISNEHYIYYDVPIAGNDTYAAELGITLAATDVISVYATLATLSFNIFGQENF